MKVDVAKIAADVAKRKGEAKREGRSEIGRRVERQSARLDVASNEILTYRCTVVEARLLVACIVEPQVLAWCETLEPDDFADLRNKSLLIAVRELQARVEHISSLDVMAELRRRDERRQTHLAEMLDCYLAELLCEHAWNTYGEPGEPTRAWVEHDLGKLRELTEHRRGM